MARTCTICAHKKREQIDQALVAGDSIRTISHNFKVSEDALKRHKKSHISKALIQSKQAETITKADDLFSEINKYKDRLDETIRQAEDTGDFKACMTGFKAILGYLEFLSKLRGELPPDGQVNVQVNIEQNNQRVIFLVDKFAGVIENISARYPEVKSFATEELRRFKEEAIANGGEADHSG